MKTFSAERLIENSRKEISLARQWLNSIERDLNNNEACIDAAVLLYLCESYAKLSYTTGMLNKTRLDVRESARTSEQLIPSN